MDVSVVISTFNRARLLEPSIDALLAQHPAHVEFEVIVVDNNSTDDTAEVVGRAAARSPGRLRYLHEPRQGVSFGRNTGIEAAQGRIVAFTDDDIRVDRDWIVRIAEAFDTFPHVEIIGGRVLPIWSGTPPRWLDSRHWSPLSVTDYGERPFEISAARPICLLTSNIAVRREVFPRIGGFSPDFPRSQDHELQLRFWRAGGRALYLPSLVVYTAVPDERLERRYHRWWHYNHGRYSARMALRELTAPDGSLRSGIGPQRTVAGIPAFLLRELGTELGAYLMSWRGAPAARFEREVRIRHLVGYIAERRRLGSAHRPPTVADPTGRGPQPASHRAERV